MKPRNPVSLLLAWLGLAVVATDPVRAADAGVAPDPVQQTGIITGRISNAATNLNLEGAIVRVERTDYSTYTARNGIFRLQVPPGDHVLLVSYTGLDAQSIPVSVQAGATVQRDVELTAKIYKMSAFHVSGEREGNAMAVTQQRNAPNVKNVLSADAFGNVADANLGDVLMRVPGVGAVYGEGQITAVQIRGVSAEYNAVTIDGTRGASGDTTALTREFAIDRLPADMISMIEVVKAPTSEMDADSIGGVVNLRTKSPFDQPRRIVSYQLGYSYRPLRDSFRPAGAFTYSDILGKNRNWGVLLTSSYNKTHKPRGASYLAFEPTPETNRPIWFHGATNGLDELGHTRAGLGLRVDHKLTDSATVYVNTLYSYYQDTLNRRWNSVAGIDGRVVAFYDAAGLPRAANNQTATILPGWTGTVTETINHSNSRNQVYRKRGTETISVTVGAEHTLFGGKIDYNANYSVSDGDEQRYRSDLVVAGVGFRHDRSAAPDWVKLTQISGPDVNDPANATIAYFEKPTTTARDRIKAAQLNWRRDLDTPVPSYIKTGFRYRSQMRDQDVDWLRLGYVGADRVAGRNPATGINDDNIARFLDQDYNHRPYGGVYPNVKYLHLPTVDKEYLASPQLFQEDIVTSVRNSNRTDGIAEENVLAAYFMGNVQLGRLNILGGVRVEETRVSAEGNVLGVTAEERARRAAWVGTVTPEETRRRTQAEYLNLGRNQGEYRDLFPNIHFRYAVTDNLLARLSYSPGIGRPTYTQLIPRDNINDVAMTLVTNNVNLRPEYSDNFDFSLEYYFKPVGLVSVGLFLKEISNFVYRGESPIPPDSIYYESYAHFTQQTFLNGGYARVRGAEFAYQQQFSNLPGPWRGFGVFANYTWLETEGDYGNVGNPTDLVGFVPRSGNLGVSYTGGGFTIRAKANYQGKQLWVYNANPVLRRYRVPRTPLDLNISYAWSPRLNVFVDVVDVFESPLDMAYLYEPSRRQINAEYGRLIKFGVSGRF